MSSLLTLVGQIDWCVPVFLTARTIVELTHSQRLFVGRVPIFSSRRSASLGPRPFICKPFRTWGLTKNNTQTHRYTPSPNPKGVLFPKPPLYVSPATLIDWFGLQELQQSTHALQTAAPPKEEGKTRQPTRVPSLGDMRWVDDMFWHDYGMRSFLRGC